MFSTLTYNAKNVIELDSYCLQQNEKHKYKINRKYTHCLCYRYSFNDHVSWRARILELNIFSYKHRKLACSFIEEKTSKGHTFQIIYAYNVSTASTTRSRPVAHICCMMVFISSPIPSRFTGSLLFRPQSGAKHEASHEQLTAMLRVMENE